MSVGVHWGLAERADGVKSWGKAERHEMETAATVVSKSGTGKYCRDGAYRVLPV